MRQIILIIVAFLAIGIPAVHAEKNIMLLRYKDGTTLGVNLSDNPELFFTAENIEIVANSEVIVSFSQKDILNLSYVENLSSVGTVDLNSSRISVLMRGELITFTGLTEKSHIQVYTLSGLKLVDCLVESAGDYTLNLPNNNENLLIAVINGKSFKFVKK